MRAPLSLRLEDYPLTGSGAASDLFPWARVKDDRNLHGPGSIAVPGVVAGMEEAHRRHAKMPWKDLLAPSVTLAGDGLAVDWWTTLMIASSAADLRRYPASAAAYLQDGLPPNAQWGIRSQVRMPQDKLKATMAQLAAQGPRDFYEGDLARSIAADVQAAVAPGAVVADVPQRADQLGHFVLVGIADFRGQQKQHIDVGIWKELSATVAADCEQTQLRRHPGLGPNRFQNAIDQCRMKTQELSGRGVVRERGAQLCAAFGKCALVQAHGVRKRQTGGRSNRCVHCRIRRRDEQAGVCRPRPSRPRSPMP